jgi:hypothetical protein
MNDKTVTVPGRPSVVKINTTSSSGAKPTSHTSAANYEQVKHLLSDKPLRAPARPS